MDLASATWRELLVDAAGAMGVALTREQAGLFSRYAQILTQWNRKVNLTTIIQPEQIAIKHFVDSLAALHHIGPGANLMDIGTGAGFPGLPLKIVRPDLAVTLVDSVRKKISFVNHLIHQLGVTGIRAMHSRAETLARTPQYLGAFDVVTSRALAELDQIIRLAVPFLKLPGRILAYKGPNQITDSHAAAQIVARELERTGRAGAARVSQVTYTLPLSGDARTLIIIELTAPL